MADDKKPTPPQKPIAKRDKADKLRKRLLVLTKILIVLLMPQRVMHPGQKRKLIQ